MAVFARVDSAAAAIPVVDRLASRDQGQMPITIANGSDVKLDWWSVCFIPSNQEAIALVKEGKIMSQELIPDEKKAKMRKPEQAEPAQTHEGGPGAESSALLGLQQRVGNRAVQRLIAQRSGDGAFHLDDETTQRINGARGGGQALDSGVQQQMGAAMGHDFSGVRVHTSPESHQLNQQLNAKAFTTGQDIFFKQGEYNPGSGSGQELLAHELTHVVQQSSGRVSGSSGMTVNAPGDTFEQEADAVARQAVTVDNTAASETATSGVQREEAPEDELQAKTLQREELPEEEELQAKTVQREELPEDELQAKTLQREAMPEEEEELG